MPLKVTSSAYCACRRLGVSLRGQFWPKVAGAHLLTYLRAFVADLILPMHSFVTRSRLLNCQIKDQWPRPPCPNGVWRRTLYNDSVTTLTNPDGGTCLTSPFARGCRCKQRFEDDMSSTCLKQACGI